MTLFHICAVLFTFAAAAGYLNQRFLRLPETIGQMAIALVVSLVALYLNTFSWFDATQIKDFAARIDFSDVLLHGMLSFLLFAGALHINLNDLKKVGWPVGVLSTFGVVLATAIIGTAIWFLSRFTQLPLSYPYALLFGALIAPTDPIAVLSMLKKSNVSNTMSVQIGAESLFNDGVGIVIFITILEVIGFGQAPSIANVAGLLAQEALGGLALGCVLGAMAYYLIRSINSYKVEVLLTLALVMGGTMIAEMLHVSAPICMVASGLIIGNHGFHKAMETDTRQRLSIFWDLIDEILNALLFMMIGLKILTLDITAHHIALGCLAIVAVLLGRLTSVSIPVLLLGFKTQIERGTIGLLTWGGLRGGLSVAMALSLPESSEKAIIVPIAYIVVLFSILVQGLTFPYAIKMFRAQ